MCLGTHRRKVTPVLGHRAIDESMMNTAVAATLPMKQQPLPTTTITTTSTGEELQQQQQQQHSQSKRNTSHGSNTGGVHIIVQHNYHDHSADPDTEFEDEHPARGGVSTPFPFKLHEMLQGVKANNQEDIVSWQPHGRCFVVHNPKEFVQLLPKYFKLSKLPSFQRQLNLYGFQRLTRGKDRGGYYHELFLRGKTFLAHAIQRIKVKGTGVRARSNPEQEPNFWSMPWMEEDGSTSTPPPLSSSATSSSTKEKNRSSKKATRKSPPAADATTSFVYPGPTRMCYPEMPSSTLRATTKTVLTSPMVPVVSPQGSRQTLKKSSTAATPSSTHNYFMMPDSSAMRPSYYYRQQDEDIVCAFGDKTFHYLDPFQPLSLEEVQKQPSNFSIVSSVAQQQQQANDVTNTEAESFFEGFEFPDIVGSEIENDAIFGEMLESLIA